MRNTLNDWFFHLAAMIGSGVYIVTKPDKNFWLNFAKFLVGYLCSLFTAPAVMAILQWFFSFTDESFVDYLPAAGFVIGVLGMTLFDSVIHWLRGDFGGVLTEVIRSWLVRRKD